MDTYFYTIYIFYIHIWVNLSISKLHSPDFNVRWLAGTSVTFLNPASPTTEKKHLAQHPPAHQKVVHSIPSPGTYLGWRFSPWCVQKATDR